MVIPRSRSMSIESRYWARMSRGSTASQYSRIRSARVDLPWSMCAITETLRMASGRVIASTLTSKLPSSELWSLQRHGQHQEPEEAHSPQRPAPGTEQGGLFGAEDARQGR